MKNRIQTLALRQYGYFSDCTRDSLKVFNTRPNCQCANSSRGSLVISMKWNKCSSVIVMFLFSVYYNNQKTSQSCTLNMKLVCLSVKLLPLCRNMAPHPKGNSTFYFPCIIIHLLQFKPTNACILICPLGIHGSHILHCMHYNSTGRFIMFSVITNIFFSLGAIAP